MKELNIEKTDAGYTIIGDKAQFLVTVLGTDSALDERKKVRRFILHNNLGSSVHHRLQLGGLVISCATVDTQEITAGALLTFANNPDSENKAHLEDLVVKPNFRGKGLGSAVCKIAFHEAFLAGKTSVGLLSSQDAKQFYKRLGPSQVIGAAFMFDTANFTQL